MRRPTVLFINRVFPPVHGASGRVLKDLAQAFAREGWHVTVVSSGLNAGEERIQGVRIIRVKGPEKPAYVLSYVWVWLKMLMLALRLKGRHLVVTMSDPPLIIFAGQIVARLKKSRHINWCHDLYPELLPVIGMKIPDWAMTRLTALRNRCMRRCDKIVVVGRCMAKYLAQEGVDAKKIAMIPNWPDVELTDPEMIETTGKSYQDLDPKIARPFDEQKKSQERFRILYAGNLGRAHCVETVIDAAEVLQEQGSDVEFVFVGNGKRFDELAELRAKKGLDNIRLLPFQPVEHLRNMMESGYVHLISMKDDAAGYLVPSKLYAALAVARPSIFIGPSQSETAKVLNDFDAGTVVAHGDVEALVQAVNAYRHDSDLWQAGQNGAARARDVFTPQGSLKAWTDRAMDVVHDDLRA